MKSSLRLWRLLALVLAALLLVHLATAAGGTEAPEDEEDTAQDTDEEEAQQLWWASSGGAGGGRSGSRMLLATVSKPKPHKCYKSNCNKNDTAIAVCKQVAHDAKSDSIRCCKFSPTTSICRDLSSDSSFCGTCTTVCPAGQVCCRGTCTATCCDGACPGGLTCCNNRCVDSNSDSSNCGACETACPSDPPGAWACCGGSCAFLFGTDEVNCGACDSHCNDRCCGGVCKNLWTDPNFCGSCDPVLGKCPPDARICCDHACYNSTPGFTCQG